MSGPDRDRSTRDGRYGYTLRFESGGEPITRRFATAEDRDRDLRLAVRFHLDPECGSYVSVTKFEEVPHA